MNDEKNIYKKVQFKMKKPMNDYIKSLSAKKLD